MTAAVIAGLVEVGGRVVADHVDAGQRVAAARNFQHSATRCAGRIADDRVIAAVKRGHQVLDSIQLCSIKDATADFKTAA